MILIFDAILYFILLAYAELPYKLEKLEKLEKDIVFWNSGWKS